MSVAYSKYLDQHFRNVYNGYDWIRDNLPDVLNGEDYEIQIRSNHDHSKFSPEEYSAYDKYFYGKEETPTLRRISIWPGFIIFTTIPTTGSTGFSLMMNLVKVWSFLICLTATLLR